MRVAFGSMVLAVLVLAAACGSPDRNTGGDDDSADAAPSCEGLGCRVVDCAAQGKPPTTISGKVFAPNGTLALFGVNVYIPASDPGPLEAGVTCSRCTDTLQGGSVRAALSGDDGSFLLDNAPSGLNIPIVIQVGKWRRQVVMPNVVECTDNVLPVADSSLPRSKLQGDLPKIAIVTGSLDALECLVRKVGVADSEFSAAGGAGSVQLFASNGANKFSSGTAFTGAHTLWSDLDKMKQYDAALFSCEGDQNEDEKTQVEMNNVQAYADAGGRVFMTHLQNIWFDGRSAPVAGTPAPSAEWQKIATCAADQTTSTTATIDQISNPKGASFAKWMVNVQGSTAAGVISIMEPRQLCSSVDKTIAEQWMYASSTNKPQTIQFTTPQLEPMEERRCGKVVFSDVHVASGSSSSPSTGFPGGCSSDPLSPQEKALAFMLFDISSCVGTIF